MVHGGLVRRGKRLCNANCLGDSDKAASVRWMIEGLSASSVTLFWCFLPLYPRENGVKTYKMSVYYHAK
jgi:hypothetical protein